VFSLESVNINDDIFEGGQFILHNKAKVKIKHEQKKPTFAIPFLHLLEPDSMPRGIIFKSNVDFKGYVNVAICNSNMLFRSRKEMKFIIAMKTELEAQTALLCVYNNKFGGP